MMDFDSVSESDLKLMNDTSLEKRLNKVECALDILDEYSRHLRYEYIRLTDEHTKRKQNAAWEHFGIERFNAGDQLIITERALKYFDHVTPPLELGQMCIIKRVSALDDIGAEINVVDDDANRQFVWYASDDRYLMQEMIEAYRQRYLHPAATGDDETEASSEGSER